MTILYLFFYSFSSYFFLFFWGGVGGGLSEKIQNNWIYPGVALKQGDDNKFRCFIPAYRVKSFPNSCCDSPVTCNLLMERKTFSMGGVKKSMG
jgi:hypothetical protein